MAVDVNDSLLEHSQSFIGHLLDEVAWTDDKDRAFWFESAVYLTTELEERKEKCGPRFAEAGVVRDDSAFVKGKSRVVFELEFL